MINALQKRIGYTFKDAHLLELALIHPSWRNEHSGQTDDNQRLEFLGDAVFGLLAAESLFRTHQTVDEGPLSFMRSRLISADALAEIGRELGIGEMLKFGRGEAKMRGGAKTNNLCDGVEAIMGAIFLDGGYLAAKAFFQSCFPNVEELPEPQDAPNPRNQLQDCAHKYYSTAPVYTLVERTGPDHAPSFTMCASIPHTNLSATAVGTSKRVASTHAAEQLLLRIAEVQRRRVADSGEGKQEKD